MSTCFYLIKENKIDTIEDVDFIDNPNVVLVGQRSFGSRFLFGPKFPQGLFSLNNYLKENKDLIAIDEYRQQISKTELLLNILETVQFPNHPENLKHCFITNDGFLYSIKIFF